MFFLLISRTATGVIPRYPARLFSRMQGMLSGSNEDLPLLVAPRLAHRRAEPNKFSSVDEEKSSRMVSKVTTRYLLPPVPHRRPTPGMRPRLALLILPTKRNDSSSPPNSERRHPSIPISRCQSGMLLCFRAKAVGQGMSISLHFLLYCLYHIIFKFAEEIT